MVPPAVHEENSELTNVSFFQINREPEPVERAHFQPAVGDSGYFGPKYRVV